MFEEMPELLTRKQCQELLQISKTTILNLINSNALPAHILAGSYRILKTDLIDFVNNSVLYK